MEEYCAYLRKSRADLDAESRGEGETLARHEKVLIELALRQNLNIKAIYREIVSGETIAARPVMQQLLSEVEQGIWSGCLVMEVERLARGDTIDQGIVAQTFKYSGTKIITPLKTYDPNNEFDEEYFEFGLYMSRREYKTINRRLQRGRLASIKEGKYVASRPPYGYLRRKLDNDKGWTLEPHPDQADVVRMIFNLYVNGEVSDGVLKRLGTGLITNRLNALRIPTRNGNEWIPVSVRDILINPVYIGKLRWNWRPENKKMTNGHITIERQRNYDCTLVDGLHPALIDEVTFNKAQAILKLNPSPLSGKLNITNPLAGLVVCGKCGHKMQRRPYMVPDKHDSLICPYTSCPNVSADLDYVETRILSSLDEWLTDYKLKWSVKVPNRAETDLQRKSLKKLESDLSDLYAQLNNVHDLLEKGTYDTDTFLSRSSIIKEKISAAESAKHDIENALKKEDIRRESNMNLIPKVEHLLSVYSELSSAQAKNDLLKEVLEKAVYTKEVKGYGSNRPDDFQIVIYPKFPHV